MLHAIPSRSSYYRPGIVLSRNEGLLVPLKNRAVFRPCPSGATYCFYLLERQRDQVLIHQLASKFPQWGGDGAKPGAGDSTPGLPYGQRGPPLTYHCYPPS